jgi:hypothetical protein
VPSSPPSSANNPTFLYSIHGTGYDTHTIRVYVNRVLKIRFTPGQQDSTIAGTGFSPVYSKLAVYITVGSTSQPTPLLSNGVASEAQQSLAMDFSNAFSHACSASDTSCRQAIDVTIEKPNYDYWCFNFGMYCSHTHVQDNHPWNGTVEIATDDTVAM